MNIAALRERIRLAESQEREQGSLRAWLGQQLAHLHPAITPGDDPLDTLQAFAEGYIAEVPDTLEAAQAVAASANRRWRKRFFCSRRICLLIIRACWRCWMRPIWFIGWWKR